ncbi:MAG: type III PLP-dependent enzyme [Nitrospirota bacterium]|nr:type III PLP-dependent enzyme [Nitrospirota bacterium]
MPYSSGIAGVYEPPPLPIGAVRAHAAQGGTPTPYLLCDIDIVELKVQRLRDALPGVTPYYAMKANPDVRVIERLKSLGVHFEVASIHELEMLANCGVDPREVIFSNPIKPLEAIRRAWEMGVTTMAVDDLDEIAKIGRVSGDIRMYLRMETSNTGSDWPLTGKFGSSISEAMEIIDHCADRGLKLIGLTFHVGSQCRNLDNWHTGIEGAQLLFSRMRERGLAPSLLNMGGGFPIQHTRPIPTMAEIGHTVQKSLAGLDPGIQVIAEPGRYLVGDSCWMVTRVVGTATRKGRRWLYLDIGAFTGLAETLEKFDYELLSDREGRLTPMTVAGPSCDTADVLFEEKMLPEDLEAGDFVYIPNAGAYTTAYASTFNGFPLPGMVLLERSGLASRGKVEQTTAG